MSVWAQGVDRRRLGSPSGLTPRAAGGKSAGWHVKRTLRARAFFEPTHG